MDNNIKLLLGITDPNLNIDPKYQYTSYIEEKIIMKMGKKKIEQLNELLEEWNLNFKKYKDEEFKTATKL